jgi:acyl-coenzyme A synthetase/AMP-(fatty) acid ligase
VQMACVIGVPNEETTTLAKALVVLKEGTEATGEELIQLVAAKLPLYKHLHGGLQFIDHLPENKGRKVDKVAINKLYGGKKKLTFEEDNK